MSSLLIRNGRIVDPASARDETGDLLIIDGRIADGRASGARVDHMIDARGRLVVPGLIDPHVHLREPGDEAKETIATGTAAAVAGGFATVCCMPNTNPALDNVETIDRVIQTARRAGRCNVFPIAAITQHRAGRKLVDFQGLQRAGGIAFSDDGVGVADGEIMRAALIAVNQIGSLLTQHCEDPALSRGGAMNEGDVSRSLDIRGAPAQSESAMIQRDLQLNRHIGCRYHVQHISAAESVELVRAAKREGINVTCEVSPHHLLLTDECCRSLDTNFKMNPPLRSARDVAACIAGVIDGTIDCLATDHAPHLATEKARDFESAPFGIIGLESALPLYVKALIEPGHIAWPRLIALMSAAPARILKLNDRGTLRVGAIADVTVIDPEVQWTIDLNRFHSKSRNSPFDGWSVKGRATHTIVGGEIKWPLD